MRSLRSILCALLIIPLLFLFIPPAAAEDTMPVSQAFVQGENLYVYLSVEADLDAQLHRGEGPVPASNGIQSVAEAGYPVAYYLLVDDSTSMQRMRQKVLNFASALAQNAAPGTRFAVLTFGERLRIVQEETQDADQLLASLQSLTFDDQMTDLPQGVLDAYAYLESSGREEGELVHAVLISDGVTEEAQDSPGLDAARQLVQNSPCVLLHTLGIATTRAESADGLSALASLGIGVHATLPSNVWDGFAAAEEIVAYSNALSVLTFPLGAPSSTPFDGSIFFRAQADGMLYGRAELANVPVLSIGHAVQTLPEPADSASADPSATPAPSSTMPDTTEAPSETPSSDVDMVVEPSDPLQSPLPADESAGLPVWMIAVGVGLAAVLMALFVILLLWSRKAKRHHRAPSAPGRQSDNRTDGIYMRLEVISGEYTGKRNEFSLHDELTIGSARSCDLVWKEPGVEPVHARIFLREGLIYLEDLGSAQGTLLGGMRLHEANRLRSGDEITVGSVRFRMKF